MEDSNLNFVLYSMFYSILSLSILVVLFFIFITNKFKKLENIIILLDKRKQPILEFDNRERLNKKALIEILKKNVGNDGKISFPLVLTRGDLVYADEELDKVYLDKYLKDNLRTFKPDYIPLNIVFPYKTGKDIYKARFSNLLSFGDMHVMNTKYDEVSLYYLEGIELTDDYSVYKKRHNEKKNNEKKKIKNLNLNIQFGSDLKELEEVSTNLLILLHMLAKLHNKDSKFSFESLGIDKDILKLLRKANDCKNTDDILNKLSMEEKTDMIKRSKELNKKIKEICKDLGNKIY